MTQFVFLALDILVQLFFPGCVVDSMISISLLPIANSCQILFIIF